MHAVHSLIAGAAGAAALTTAHQTIRPLVSHPPRVDVVGRRAIARPMRAMGFEPPLGQRLQQAALAGDLLSNSIYYALLGLSRPENLWRNALALGLAAGVGAVALPPLMGLGSKPTSRASSTALLTVGYYTLGAFVAAGALRLMQETGRV